MRNLDRSHAFVFGARAVRWCQVLAVALVLVSARALPDVDAVTPEFTEMAEVAANNAPVITGLKSAVAGALSHAGGVPVVVSQDGASPGANPTQAMKQSSGPIFTGLKSQLRDAIAHAETEIGNGDSLETKHTPPVPFITDVPDLPSPKDLPATGNLPKFPPAGPPFPSIVPANLPNVPGPKPTKVPAPQITKVPVPKLTKVQVPTIPNVPVPKLPNLPLPTLPDVPKLPNLPLPTLPEAHLPPAPPPSPPPSPPPPPPAPHVKSLHTLVPLGVVLYIVYIVGINAGQNLQRWSWVREASFPHQRVWYRTPSLLWGILIVFALPIVLLPFVFQYAHPVEFMPWGFLVFLSNALMARLWNKEPFDRNIDGSAIVAMMVGVCIAIAAGNSGYNHPWSMDFVDYSKSQFTDLFTSSVFLTFLIFAIMLIVGCAWNLVCLLRSHRVRNDYKALEVNGVMLFNFNATNAAVTGLLGGLCWTLAAGMVGMFQVGFTAWECILTFALIVGTAVTFLVYNFYVFKGLATHTVSNFVPLQQVLEQVVAMLGMMSLTGAYQNLGAGWVFLMFVGMIAAVMAAILQLWARTQHMAAEARRRAETLPILADQQKEPLPPPSPRQGGCCAGK